MKHYTLWSVLPTTCAVKMHYVKVATVEGHVRKAQSKC